MTTRRTQHLVRSPGFSRSGIPSRESGPGLTDIVPSRHPAFPAFLALLAAAIPALAQELPRRQSDPVPAEVETIYKRGLDHLATSQNERGSWDDSMGSEPGVVGLCIASFLAHGEDPNHGPYARQIGKSVEYLITQQNEANGYIGDSMYNHGFATKALAECYGMVDNPKLAPALEKAVDLILTSQGRSRFGGWRYTPESRDADTTVTGCQVVALFAARNAGVPVPEESIKKALGFLAKCRSSDGSYGYTSASGGKPTLTAIGVLCMALAKETNSKSFLTSLEYLKDKLDYRDRFYPFYYEYYMSQALFHADEETWREWNALNTRYLATIQAPDGSWPGNKGQAFSTAGALLSLALNYRFLPIYEK